jgi:hypothetical protein
VCVWGDAIVGQPVQVDVPGVRKVGAAVTDASDRFRTAFTANLAGPVRTFGDGLSRSANDLAATDEAAAYRVAGAGRPPR